jgi:hypothetical protein
MTEAEMFKTEVQEEILEIKERLEALRSKFTDNHDSSPDKSFLKQELKHYLDCLPMLKTERLEAMIQKD